MLTPNKNFISFPNQMQIAHLPEEIITEIFLRLPVETLLILKCVNKFCLHLISNPDFVKAHLKISTEDASFSSYSIILVLLENLSSFLLKQFSMQSLLNEAVITSLNLEYPDKNLRRLNDPLMGSCNGLVLIAVNDKYLFLGNPSIGMYKNLASIDVDTRGYFVRYGFGYDECNDDYKVVCIFHVYGSKAKEQSMVKVYSLKRNSWKRTEDYKGSYLGYNWATNVSGKFHWFTHSYSLKSNPRRDIVSFDVEKEVFGIVEQPNYGGSGHLHLKLGVLGGCLCVLCYDEKTKYVNMWAMKEHGVKESWTKMVTFSCIHTLEECNGLRPWSILPNGEILLHSIDSSFVIYNPKDNSFRLPMMRKWGNNHEPVIYVESLVSPFAYGG